MSIDTFARREDIYLAGQLVEQVCQLSRLGTSAQRRGRDQAGRFVERPRAIEAQIELEGALLVLSKRIRFREERYIAEGVP